MPALKAVLLPWRELACIAGAMAEALHGLPNEVAKRGAHASDG
jgi:hypothetical protein